MRVDSSLTLKREPMATATTSAMNLLLVPASRPVFGRESVLVSCVCEFMPEDDFVR